MSRALDYVTEVAPLLDSYHKSEMTAHDLVQTMIKLSNEPSPHAQPNQNKTKED